MSTIDIVKHPAPLGGAEIRARRILWIDCSKGLGIVLVVFAHGWRGLIDNGQMTWSPILHVVDYAVYSFHMPLFFMLSGYTSSILNKSDRPKYIKSKLRTVAYPYFLWSIMVGLILIFFVKNSNTHFSWREMMSLPWLPIQQFWFLQALFAMQMMRSVIVNNNKFIIICFIIFLVSFTFRDRDETLAVISHFCIFFAVGIVMHDHFDINTKSKADLYLSLLVLVFVFLVGLAIYSGSHYMSVIFLPAAVSGILLTIQLSKVLDLHFPRLDRLLSAFGRVSMTVYVSHIIVMSGLRTILIRIAPPMNAWLLWLVCVAAGLLIPISMHIFLDKTNLLWVFGLGKKKRSKAILAT